VIIVSLTTSNTGFAKMVAAFFFQPQRINVAVTRPSHKLIIAGSRHVLKTQLDDPELQEAVALMRELIESCARFTLADALAGEEDARGEAAA
jgi:DNA replication ATP-dependent helicase Dna2